jgi:hypothetical protein
MAKLDNRQMAARRVAQRKVAKKRALIANPRVQFAAWLQDKMPDVFAVAEQAAMNQSERLKAMQAGVYGGAQLGGFMDFFTAPVETIKEATTATVTAVKSTWEKLLDGAIAGGTAYLTYQNQKDMLALNIERAKAGLPPVDSATTAPVIRTVVDLDPTLARDITSNIGSSINRNMMIFGGLAIAALLFFGMRK